MNGKALMSGIRLEEMEMSDMLDVIHFILEDDLASATGEQAEARSNTREMIYREFYNKEYQYKAKGTSRNSSGSRSGSYADGTPIDDFSDIEPFDPLEHSAPPKPFVPATDFNPDSALPFGSNLDAPLG